MKQELSAEQAAIAYYNEGEGALLVEAAAGSGKTRILTERVRYLLTEKPEKHFSVLCLTFTNKAAEEIKNRLHTVPKITERAFIDNIHSFCLHNVLRTRRREIGLLAVPHIFNVDDTKQIIEEILIESFFSENDYNSLDKKEQANKILSYQNMIGLIKRNLETNLDDVITNDFDLFVYKEYNSRLITQNAMDYDDILLYAYRILSENPASANLYRRIYPYILIDEAQDLNYAQYHFLRVLCGETNKNLVLIGDPNQAIYSFNGASIDFMQKYFVEDFGAIRKEIQYNYRSSENVLKLAKFIKQTDVSLPKNYFEGEAVIKECENEVEEAEWVIENIKQWIFDKKKYQEKDITTIINFENIAVLARNRYVFKELIAQLSQEETLKNNFYLKQSLAQFEPESKLIKIFDLGLKVMSNPSDVLHFSQIFHELGMKMVHCDDKFSYLINDFETETKKTEIIVSFNLSIIISAWRKLKNNQSLFDIILDDIKLEVEKIKIDNTFNTNEISSVLYDIDDLKKKWRNFLTNSQAGSHNLANFGHFLAINNALTVRQGLTLATVHTVKGLEYEIVFLMGMTEGTFPDYRANTSNKIREERNNAYVAVTRAKKCIYVSFPKKRTTSWGEKTQVKSSFIKDFK